MFFPRCKPLLAAIFGFLTLPAVAQPPATLPDPLAAYVAR